MVGGVGVGYVVTMVLWELDIVVTNLNFGDKFEFATKSWKFCNMLFDIFGEKLECFVEISR